MDSLSGTVQRVNGTGLLLAGHGWVNVSKFAKAADVPMPEVGQAVVIATDKSGFARKIEIAAPTPAPAATSAASAPITTTTPPATSSPPTRDVQIARMNAVGNAVAILSSGGRPVELEDVLAVAEVLENWVTR